MSKRCHPGSILLKTVCFCLGFMVVFGGRLSAAEDILTDSGEEFVQDGGFELGIVNVDIRRFPRYDQANSKQPAAPSRDSVKAISGGYSLLLPGLERGGYTLVYPTYLLSPGWEYRFRIRLNCSDIAKVNVIAFTGGWNRAMSYKQSLDAGLQVFESSFIVTSNKKTQSNEVPHFLRLTIRSRGDCLLDDVSFSGRGEGRARIPVFAWLTPDRPMAVYPIGSVGTFTLAVTQDQGAVTCEIFDPIQKAIVAKSRVVLASDPAGAEQANVPLSTVRRGFYWVRCGISGKDGNFDERARRAYVVIDPEPGSSAVGRRFYAASAEEHGPRSDIDAAISPDDLYGLAKAVGIDTIRIFALANPGLLSKDGIRYDFAELDAAIATMDRHQLDRFMVLGVNATFRTPAWMRKPTGSGKTVDLLSGLIVPYEKKRFIKRGGDRYLDIDNYRAYLETLMQHVGKRVGYYEVWNEPGHKFSVDDIVRLTSVTRSVQRKIAPTARLLGFSSTVHADRGKGRNREHLPSLLDAVARQGGLTQIDGISFHGRHAFKYLSPKYDERNLDTGFVKRLRRIARREGKVDMPLWSTEFGISWRSPHLERLDAHAGAPLGQLEYPRSAVTDVLDVARQLPAVYAQAAADGIDRLVWFTLDSSIADIAHPERRWVFFDAMLEPMPHLAAFDAMTQVLGMAAYSRNVERDDGLRAYLFSRDHDTVIVMYNWKEKLVDVSVQVGDVTPLVLDVMGNPADFRQAGDAGISVPVNGWPKYIIVPNTPPFDVAIR